MLSEKIKTFCENKGWWYEDYTNEYANSLKKLDIDLKSEFALFFLHVEDSATFYSRGREIYQVCWFAINTDYDLNIKSNHKALKLPEEYIPLSSFEAESGFFYNRKTGEVIELELGDKLTNFQNGIIDTKWDNFNDFLEYFFELD
ncbi:hypothetical protein Q4599_17270 [Cellulophaga lytica]|uniref:hypothetical protein n=1 Tax=Cellulophaga lytica TaxID=979 RepID=UPI0026E15A35|nr:hypothetical protein [Cellulophaga lytica]MDO6855330.1 hypothetical protein [Cellulophaga lytica]